MSTPAPGSTSCVAYNDVLDYLDNCNAPELCATQAKVEENLELAQEFLEGLLGSKICPYAACKTFKCSNDCLIFWHFQDSDPLLEVVSVTLNGKELDTNDYEVSDYSIKLLSENFKCSDVVVIEGTWGIPVSKLIKRAIILLALEYSQPGITGMSATDSGVKEVTWSDFSIEYFDPESSSSSGFKEVDRLLQAAMPTFKSFNFIAIGNTCRKCESKECKCGK